MAGRLVLPEGAKVSHADGHVLTERGPAGLFDDAALFASIRTEIERIVRAKRPGDAFRIWVVEGGHGEDAYSYAMLAYDSLGELVDDVTLRVFATNPDPRATQAARSGRYPAATLGAVPPALRHYLARRGEVISVKKRIRDCCVFAVHDVVSQPPLSNLDLISCRSRLGNDATSHHLVAKLHYALRAGGCLVLGADDASSLSNGLFEHSDASAEVLRRKEGAAPNLAAILSFAPANARSSGPRPEARLSPPPNLHAAVQEALVRAYAPAAALVDGDGRVLYVSGGIHRYLRPSLPAIPRSIADLCLPELQSEVKALLGRRAPQARHGAAIGNPVLLTLDHHKVVVQVIARILGTPGRHPLRLLSFEEQDLDLFAAPEALVALGMRQELTATSEELEAVTDELESTREELHTSTEELRTLLDEMHGANDELSARNRELALENGALVAARDDAERRYAAQLAALDERVRTLFAERTIAEAAHRDANARGRARASVP